MAAFTVHALFLSFLAAPAPTAIPLWPDGAPGAIGKEPADIPEIAAFLPPKDTASGAACIVCPGGGYGVLAPHEGEPVAEWLNTLGIAGFVLKYRIAPRYKHPSPLLDAQRAIRTVRARASEWGVRHDAIGILGFSAGGHLTTTAATHFDPGKPDAADPIERTSSRPDFTIPIYPVVTMGRFTHEGSKRNLLGPDPSADLIELLSNEKQVTRNCPPFFIIHTVDDAAVPCENSLMLAAALRENGVPFELHLYERGPHGFGLGGNNRILSSWTLRCADWLRLHGWASAAPPAVPAAPPPR